MKARRYLVAVLTALILAGAQASTSLAADPVVGVAGDIACSSGSSGGSCKQGPTSDLLIQMNPDAVLPLGDVQYEKGEYANFVNFYAPSWGRLLAKTYPVVGNHEYGTPNASGYFDYYNGIGVFGGRAGDRNKGYYSFNLGSWHLVALNSNCSAVGGCGATSAMAQWLRADLAANPSACTAVYAHHPRWTSDTRDFDKPEIGPLMQILYDNQVELYLVGHSHFYERFAPTRPDQSIDTARGFRQFIVGTGGRNVYGFGAIEPASQVRNGTTFGVLKLVLHPGAYTWQFVPIAGQTFTDSGSDVCHGTAPDTTPPTAPGELTQGVVGGGLVDLSWTASTDNVAVAVYRVFRDGVQLATTSSTSYSDTTVSPSTTYAYHVVAVDTAGNPSAPSNTVTATTGPPDRMLTFTATEDATLVQASPNANAGGALILETDNSPVQAFVLKFPVSGIAGGTVTNAKIRLYNVNASNQGGYVRRLPSSTWVESAVTWANVPAADPIVLSSLGAVTPNTWYETSVAGAVTGDGNVSFRVDSTSTDGADYSSSEGTASFAPQLILTVAGAAAPDTEPPTAPTNLTAVAGSATRVDLSWGAATDNVGVTDYRIFRAGVQIGTSAGTTYADTTVAPATPYSYHVVAVDARLNVSPASNTANVTTPAPPPDTEPPTAPTNLTAVAGSATRVDLSWGAATDNVGVTDYRIFRAGVQIGTSAGTTYADTTVAPATPYSYHVVAVDARLNVSPASNTANVTTPAPPAEQTLTFAIAEDAAIRSDAPTTAFGGATTLLVDNSPVRHTLLRFTVGGTAGGSILSAKLRLRCVDPATRGGDLFATSASGWSESTVTWNTAPAATGPMLASLGAVAAGGTYEVDLSSLVTGDGTYALRITSPSSNGADYTSSEGSAGLGPELEVTVR